MSGWKYQVQLKGDEGGKGKSESMLTISGKRMTVFSRIARRD